MRTMRSARRSQLAAGSAADASRAIVWLRLLQAENEWATGNNGRGRKIAEVLDLRTARVGRAGPDQKTYRHLPNVDVPR